MPVKLRRSYSLLFVWILVGLLSGLFLPSKIVAIGSPTPLAIAPTTSVEVQVKAVNTKSAEELEQEGKYFYSQSQFQRAVTLWQQAIEQYPDQDSLSRARVMSNLALAQSQLGKWTQATNNIDASLALLNNDSSLKLEQKIRALAQVLNNAGILALSQGETAQAIALWQQAGENYQQVGDELGKLRTAINQGSAFKQLGLYRRALNTLTEVASSLEQQPDSELKVAGLKSYGDILRLVGEEKRSQAVLASSLTVASRLSSSGEQSQVFFLLGNTYKINQPEKALELYQQGLEICQKQDSCLQTDLPLQIYLAQLNTWLKTPHWQQGKSLIPQIQIELARLPVNRANLDRRLNFAQNLWELRQKSQFTANQVQDLEQFLAQTTDAAVKIAYPKAQSYSLGLRGKIKEEQKEWEQAQEYTQKALLLAQEINAPEISYLWQWQLGRINQALGDNSQAIANYTQAVELLKSLSRDLAAINPDVQYSFRDSVEPVYRGLVSLLLTNDAQGEVEQKNLEAAREVIESLQIAELNNFFREACLDAQAVNIDHLDPQAAIIYPIILRDRLEVIVSLPQQPLQHYSRKIEQKQLEQIIKEFRHNIVIRSRRDFHQSAEELYDLVIRPTLKDLTKHKIKTLVIIPDGAFRNIPLSALFDGKHYLIEDYSIALTPGLQLLSPRPLKQVKLKTIAAGLTKRVDGFAKLNYVNAELKEIAGQINSRVLINQDFTSEALKQEIQYSDYPIVHIATHGQFSSSLEDTFLLAWDDRININQLETILQTRNANSQQAIELLVLSACETATGDSRAALGMAGIAVRAGAKSTLATLWSVNDRATAKLMSNFYYQLSTNHLPKAEAIRQAQLSLLHDSWYKHPFYWSSYVLLGNWL